jgi:hypothetical protein
VEHPQKNKIKGNAPICSAMLPSAIVARNEVGSIIIADTAMTLFSLTKDQRSPPRN